MTEKANTIVKCIGYEETKLKAATQSYLMPLYNALDMPDGGVSFSITVQNVLLKISLITGNNIRSVNHARVRIIFTKPGDIIVISQLY